MQLSYLLIYFAACISSTVALPTEGVVEPEGYTGAGGVAILNGIELPASKRDELELEGYTGAGGVAILNGVDLPTSD
ncbi:uncharacterized protein BDW43DRAFT_310581 [Aspergillus alliaceus]|uniref:uncharacterized protein n=1 Tax=Petromyces alliaceus TaxID=209559 RepID=UPI0012A6BD76|nr:uncharacterized protein BDW43DRAFT_310581 [Aspergillus alliaceus]KAB8234231.1 hypothetical protein BDW43DRAFT_310581 [Aspergillus alliaceus]